MSATGHWTVVREVIHSTNDGAMILSAMPGIVRRLLDEEAWRQFEAPGAGAVEHDTFTEFMEDKPPRGLDGKRSQLLALCGSDAELADRVKRLLDQEAAPAPVHVGRGHRSDMSPLSRGNGETYWLRRLKRDAPEWAGHVLDGRLSANAAAVAAGLKVRKIEVPTDPPQLAATLRRRLNKNDLQQLIDLLRGG
jgi:hypothetical protein